MSIGASMRVPFRLLIIEVFRGARITVTPACFNPELEGRRKM
jgi:hypothetical protein